MTSAATAATYQSLHTASLAARHLRHGLTPQAAERAASELRPLLGVEAVAFCDAGGLLAWEGVSEQHAVDFPEQAQEVLRSGRTVRLEHRKLDCGQPDCRVRDAILAPLVCQDRVVAVLGSFDTHVSADLVRATQAVADWVSSQVELAELDRERARTTEAELRALRAQISPHFVYNALAAIASFVRTDPVRARELLLEFADFTRYSFRSTGQVTPLADELTNIERYLALEEARFGDRLSVSLLVAPEVLGVDVPSLAIQPLVENAVRHGIEAKEGPGHISITATDLGAEAEIVVEDDGVGASPEAVRAVLSGEPGGDHVGLANVDARLRTTYGDSYGLVVETAHGAGTRVSFRVPKFSPHLHG
nr:histidine kinase [Kineosphaera limosa]